MTPRAIRRTKNAPYRTQKNFLIVMYSIREKLDVSDFDFKDFFASMALEIYDLAEKEIGANNVITRKNYRQ